MTRLRGLSRGKKIGLGITAAVPVVLGAGYAGYKALSNRK